MTDTFEPVRLPAVRLMRRLPGPIERVWAHVAQCDQLPSWYGADSTIEPREGGVVSLMGGHILGVVTQWKPPTRLIHTWNVFAPGETVSPYPESYLVIEMAEAEGAVELTLLNLPVLERFERQGAMGWATFLDIIEDAVSGAQVRERGFYMKKNAERFGVDLANLVK